MKKAFVTGALIVLIGAGINLVGKTVEAAQKNFDTSLMVLRESKEMSTPTDISQNLMYSPDGNPKNEVRIGFSSVSCDSFSRNISFVREISPGLNSSVSRTRFLDGIEYKSINNLDEQTTGRQFTYILYSEDGLKGGPDRKEVKASGIPILDPRQYCKNSKAVPMTQNVAIQLYQGLGPILRPFEDKLKESKGAQRN